MPLAYSPMMQAKMQRLFNTCVINELKYTDVDSHIKQIIKGKERYQSVSAPLNIPWYVTGILHKTICDCDFKTHLYNGDSLSGRTINVPVGYPKKGRPSFTWEQSAMDMFSFYHWDKWTDWSIPGVLYNLETVSHFEISNEEDKASELWCFSNHFESKEKEELQKCGGAIFLRRMIEKQIIPFEANYNNHLSHLKNLGSQILFMPNRSLPKAFELQRLMNISGACIKEDGRIGKVSAKAFHELTKEFLNGDPEASIF